MILVSQLLGMVDRGRGVDGSRFVGRGSLISGGSLVGRGRGSSILGLARVRHISDISTISISNLVVNSLESAIRKSNRVGSAGGITISVLTSVEVATRVVISNSVVVGVDKKCIYFSLYRNKHPVSTSIIYFKVEVANFLIFTTSFTNFSCFL